MFSGELMTLLVLLRFGCIIETVFATPQSPSTAAEATLPTSPTPPILRLIEKNSKDEGRAHWLTSNPNHGKDTRVAPWGGTQHLQPGEFERLQQEKRRKQEQQQQRFGGLQKRAALPEPAPTSSPQCEPFEQVDTEQKILYSPGYPGNYPNNTNCHVVLEAPPGHLLRLDFRDYFNIEPSEDCKFDFIEIRDGGHGFSTLLGTYCGTEFPPMLTSRERRLWLRFHSDENIEYQGFVIVYEFIPRPTSSMFEDTGCRFELNEKEGWVNSTSIEEEKVRTNLEHNMPLDCMWVIEVEAGWKIQIAFFHFSLTHPNDCESNFVDVFGEQTDIPNRIKNFCGSIADSVTSKENILHIRYYAEPSAVQSKFEILYTAFRDKPAGLSCEEDEYDCEDATCIKADLRCNGRVNCRFRWDEDDCQTESVGQSDHVIIVIVVFTLILSTIFIAFIISCCQKLIRDHKIIREHIRQSKESKLDELGRHSTKWTEKQQHQIRDMECMSVKYPPPPLSPITRNDLINDHQHHRHTNSDDAEEGSQTAERYGFQDHIVMPMKMSSGSGGHQHQGSMGWSTYDQKISTGNMLANEREMEQRFHHTMKYQPSIGTPSATAASESDASGAMCDMACQTRESLFQPIFNNNSQTPPTTTTTAASGSGHPRFSTFGYDHKHQQHHHQHHHPHHQQTSSSSIGSGNSSSFNDGDGGGQTKHAVAATTIELPSHKHHQQQQQHHRHCQHHAGGGAADQNVVDRGKSLPRRNQNNNNNNNNNAGNTANPSARPNDSHYSDIRKSAPDVIVMTSR